MLSRVADSLYWMSRYLERAEHTARIIDVNLNLMLDESASSVDRRWQRVLKSLGNPPKVTWNGDPYRLASTMIFDLETRASILSGIMFARENARQVREQISSEQWQELNRLYHEATGANVDDNAHGSQLSDFLQIVHDGAYLFQGITDSTMSHGEGWQFIQFGRYIERASATAILLDVYTSEFLTHPDRLEGNEYLEWIGLLRSCTAFEAYCRVYTADLHPERILEFLLLNKEFPHSVGYAIDTLQDALEAIHGEGGKRRAATLTRLAGRLQSSLSFADVSEIVGQGVNAYLHGIQRQCQEIHQNIYQIYINYSIDSALAG